jgi:SAM-dependent methyltransferase
VSDAAVLAPRATMYSAAPMRALPVLLLLPTLACAAARPRVPSAVAEREILDLERAWGDAELHRDGAALGAILDDRFVFTYAGFRPVDKATVIKNMVANDKPSLSTRSEQHFIIDGDVAISTGVDTVDAVVDGRPAKMADRCTTTWVHRDGRWRALSVHMAPADVALPTEADVIRWSHDAIDAWDRGDAATLGAMLSAGYWSFEEGSPTGRDKELADVAKRKASIFAKRVWSNEHVQLRERYVIFVGEAKEHQAGNDVHGGYDFDGSYSLVWCREGGGMYKIAFSSWRLAGPGAQRASWNEIFRNGTGFNKEPNQLLVDAVAKVKPGAALDIAMGQGRNALYLASRGWKVTGVDFSDEGVRAAREAAVARHLPLDAVDADLKTYDLGVAKWDLVTMIYVPDERALLDRVKKSMKPGALLVREGFADDEGSFAAGELASLFKDGFEVVRDEVVETTPDWKKDHAKVERFVARKR